MVNIHPVPALDDVRACERACEAMVVLLHPYGAEAAALALMRGWKPAVPTTALSALPVAGSTGTGQAWDAIVHGLERSGLPLSRLVLAGVAGAQDAALQLAFSPAAAGCAGVLALGDGLPPLTVLGDLPAEGRPRIRLVWTADDPLFCAAALGDMLRCLRATGLDAQGAVLARADPAARATGVSAPPPALLRLGGAYVAELVAVAMGGASRTRAAPYAAEPASYTGLNPCRSGTQ